MAIETLKWDAADYLTTEADIGEYLAAVFETGDLGDVTRALETIARARGMTEIAGNAALAQSALHQAIREGANPTLATLFALLNALHLTMSIKAAGPNPSCRAS